ncbi:MAG: MBL fold metallo-hydrolase [Planctomycetales bacterium]
MKLVLLGTTGYHPSNARHTACMMLPESGVLFDAGTAMFRARDYLITDEIDVFLSHAHLDHIVGLTFLLDVLYGREMKRVTIHGRPEDLQAIDEHLLAPALFPIKLPYEYRPLTTEIPIASGGTITHFPLKHPGGCVGYRADWSGRSMAYVTDVTADASADYVEKIRGVDLLIHECYFPDHLAELAARTGHSHITPVAEVARAAEVGRLVLVHINPLADEYGMPDLAAAREIFPNTEFGEDLATIEF